MAPFSDRKLVLLDAGGTLITLDYERIRTILGETGVIPDDALLDEAEARARRWANAGVREKLDMRALWEGYFGRIMRALRVPEERIADRIEALWEAHHSLGLWRRPIPGALEVVRSLHAAGRRLAVVSNAEGQVEADLEEAGFGPYLETVVDSHVVGVAKPDPRIFEICLERIGGRAQDAIYVGDVPAFDVDGARAAGIDPVLLDPFDVHDDVEVTRIRTLDELRGLLGLSQDGP
jgi:putative hydrolase of the HAD superfamily